MKIVSPKSMLKIIFSVFIFFLQCTVINAATLYSRQSGLWNDTLTWQSTSTGTVSCGCLPDSTDNVVIRKGNVVTVSTTESISTVTFSDTGASGLSVSNAVGDLTIWDSLVFNSADTNTIVLSINGSLNVHRSFSIHSSTNSQRTCLIQGSGTVGCDSIFVGSYITPTFSTTTRLVVNMGTGGNLSANNIAIISRRSGVISNNATFDFQSGLILVDNGSIRPIAQASATSSFVMNRGLQSGMLILTGSTPFDTSSISISGAFNSILNGANSIVDYRGLGPQQILGTPYSTLKINRQYGTIGSDTNGAYLTGPASVINLIIGDSNSNSYFYEDGHTITGSGSGGFQIFNGSAYWLGGMSPTSFPSFSTDYCDLGTTIGYANFSAGNQIVSGSPHYPTLSFVGSGNFFLVGSDIYCKSALINGGTLNLGSYTMHGSLSDAFILYPGATLVLQNTFPDNFTSYLIYTGSTINYNANITQPQSVVPLNYGNLIISGLGTKTLTGNCAVTGSLIVSSGIFDLDSYTIDHSFPVADSLIISDMATLKIGGYNTFPSNYLFDSLGLTSTIEYSGIDQVIYQSVNYANLHTSGTGTKSILVGGANLIVRGEFLNGNGVTFNNGVGAPIYIGGNWENNGSYNHGYGEVFFNSFSGLQTINSGGSHFYTLTHSGNSTLSIISNDLVVDLNLTNDSGIFDANSYQCYVANYLGVGGGEYKAGNGLQTVGNGLLVSGGNFTCLNNSRVHVLGGLGVRIEPLSTLIAPGNLGEFYVNADFRQNAGTFNHNNGTLTFTGNTGSQDYFQFGSSTYNNIVKTGSDSLILDPDTLSVIGYFYHSGLGSINANGALVSVTGLFRIDGGGSYYSQYDEQNYSGGLWISNGHFVGDTGTVNVSDVTIYSGGILTAPYGTFNVSGNWDNTGGVFQHSAYFVYFTKTSGTQTINAGNYPFYMVEHTGAGTLRLNDIVTIEDLFNNISGTFDANGYNCSIGGNWYNNSTFAANNGKVIFNGSSISQTIGGTNPTNFDKLEINNSYGVSLSHSSVVSDSLILNNGVMFINTGDSLQMNNSSPGSISTGSPSSFIDGPLVWKLNTGSDYVFPIGDSSIFYPFGVHVIGGVFPIVKVEAVDANSGGAVGVNLVSLDTNQYWKTSLVSGSFSQALVSLTRQTPTSSANVIVQSQTQNGAYSYNLVAQSDSASTVYGDTITTFNYFMIGNRCYPPSFTLNNQTFSVCQGVTDYSLTYQNPIYNPISYSIDFDATAENANFSDSLDRFLPSDSTIHISIPSNTIGAFNAILTLKTSDGCESAAYPVIITINPNPILGNSDTSDVCSGTALNIQLNCSNCLITDSLTFTWQAPIVSDLSGQSTSASMDTIIEDTLSNSTLGNIDIDYSVHTTIVNTGCVADTSISITVHPKPHITNSLTSSICSGTAVNFQLQSDINSSFDWSATDNLNVSGESLSAVNNDSLSDVLTNLGASADEFVNYYVVPTSTSGSCRGDSTGVIITVHPKPIVILPTDTTICSTSQTLINLSSTIASGASYTWTSTQSNGQLSGINNCPGSCSTSIVDLINNFSNTIVDTATYYVSTSTNSCLSDSDSIKVIVRPTPLVPSRSSTTLLSLEKLCLGSEFIPFDLEPVAGSHHYSWYSPDLNLFDTTLAAYFTESSGHALITVPGSFSSTQASIQVIDSNSFGCASDSVFTIEIDNTNSAPTAAKIVEKQPGNLLVYLDNGVQSYQWGYDSLADKSSHELLDQIYQVFIPSSSFITNTNELDTTNYYYWVIVESDGGCKTRVYYKGPYSHRQIQEPEIVNEVSVGIYPNPNNGTFEAVVKGNVYGSIQMQIFNSVGESVFADALDKRTNIFSHHINLEKLPSGMYLLRLVSANNEIVTSKILIK